MKKRILILLSLVMMFSLSSCANDKKDEGQEDVLKQQEENKENIEDKEDDVEDEEDSEEDEEDSEEDGGEDGENREEDEKEEVKDNDDGENSDEVSDLSDKQWTDMEMVFDGTKINIPEELKKMREIGWEPDYSRTDADDEYVFNAGDKIIGGLPLKNDKYDEKFEVSASFFNPKEEQITMKDAYVYHLILRGTHIFKPVEDKPEILLPGNLEWGSTKDDIIEAYGEPEGVYEGVYENSEGKEGKYYVLSYSEDFTNFLKLSVYDEYGLQEVDISYAGR